MYRKFIWRNLELVFWAAQQQRRGGLLFEFLSSFPINHPSLIASNRGKRAAEASQEILHQDMASSWASLSKKKNKSNGDQLLLMIIVICPGVKLRPCVLVGTNGYYSSGNLMESFDVWNMSWIGTINQQKYKTFWHTGVIFQILTKFPILLTHFGCNK